LRKIRKRETGMQRGRWHGRVLVLGALVVLATVTAASGASGRVSVDVATNAALRTKILVDSGGFTLYHLTSEEKGAIDCTGLCGAAWVPLLAGSSKPVAGPGLSASKLSTIKRPAGGGVQVTYNGYALYLYRGDKKPGEVNGQGAERKWYAITPAGSVTEQTAKTTVPTTTTTTTTTKTTTTPTSVTTTSGSSGVSGSTGPAGGSTTTTSTTAAGFDCPAGQTVLQGADGAGGPNNDDDGDNGNGNPGDDGDGCM
jgi:predicted lipoprotein with Yx(FWY)xxD motif